MGFSGEWRRRTRRIKKEHGKGVRNLLRSELQKQVRQLEGKFGEFASFKLTKKEGKREKDNGSCFFFVEAGMYELYFFLFAGMKLKIELSEDRIITRKLDKKEKETGHITLMCTMLILYGVWEQWH